MARFLSQRYESKPSCLRVSWTRETWDESMLCREMPEELTSQQASVIRSFRASNTFLRIEPWTRRASNMVSVECFYCRIKRRTSVAFLHPFETGILVCDVTKWKSDEDAGKNLVLCVILVNRVRRQEGQEAAEWGLSGERAQTIPFNGLLNGVISASGHPLKDNHTSRPH